MDKWTNEGQFNNDQELYKSFKQSLYDQEQPQLLQFNDVDHKSFLDKLKTYCEIYKLPHIYMFINIMYGLKDTNISIEKMMNIILKQYKDLLDNIYNSNTI